MREASKAIPIVILTSLSLACSSADPTDVEEPATGQTTPSSIPEGDYPPIPKPTGPTGTPRSASDTMTTIAPLATNFRPPIRAITGTWVVGQAYAGQLMKTNTIRTCLYTVVSGRVDSDDIRYRSKSVDCPLIEGGTYSSVVYPSRGAYIRNRLAAMDPPLRRFLVRDGAIVPGRKTEVIHDEYDGPPFGQYQGDLDRLVVGRAGCLLDGTGLIGVDPCFWWIITNASVTREPLSSTPHIRRDTYWVKVGPSETFPNSQSVEAQFTMERTYTEGTARTDTEEFGRTVSAKAGLAYEGLGVEVSGTLSETFGSSVTVQEEREVSKTFTMTIQANTTAVFELWNLIERYRFVNADGTLFQDPNYRFEVGDLTRKATVATAWTSTEFPNTH